MRTYLRFAQNWRALNRWPKLRRGEEDVQINVNGATGKSRLCHPTAVELSGLYQ